MLVISWLPTTNLIIAICNWSLMNSYCLSGCLCCGTIRSCKWWRRMYMYLSWGCLATLKRLNCLLHCNVDCVHTPCFSCFMKVHSTVKIAIIASHRIEIFVSTNIRNIKKFGILFWNFILYIKLNVSTFLLWFIICDISKCYALCAWTVTLLELRISFLGNYRYICNLEKR